LRRVDAGLKTASNTLEVVLTDGPDDDFQAIRFTFFRVINLRVHDLNSRLASAIAVQDISSSQLEDANFRVWDAEEVWFSLDCEDIDVSGPAHADPLGMQLTGAGAVSR
jgi:hypothetical protein